MRRALHAPEEFDFDYAIEDDIPPDPKLITVWRRGRRSDGEQ